MSNAYSLDDLVSRAGMYAAAVGRATYGIPGPPTPGLPTAPAYPEGVTADDRIAQAERIATGLLGPAGGAYARAVIHAHHADSPFPVATALEWLFEAPRGLVDMVHDITGLNSYVGCHIALTGMVRSLATTAPWSPRPDVLAAYPWTVAGTLLRVVPLPPRSLLPEGGGSPRPGVHVSLINGSTLTSATVDLRAVVAVTPPGIRPPD